MFVRSSLAISLLALAACDGGGGTATPDGPRQDAQTVKVTEVTCPATTPVTFETLETRFQPTTATINRGDIVKFDTTADHPIIPTPDGTMTDEAIRVGPGRTKCLRFMASGTFRFRCMIHLYEGSITVN